MLISKIKFVIVVLSGLCTVSDMAFSNDSFRCGSLENAFGPFDYRIATPDNKRLVEGAHFTREVEQLIRGKNSSGPAGDLDYTLRVFPNHPRALNSMMEYTFRIKNEQPYGAQWPVWCYFVRAIRFQPDDPQVKMLYAIYLKRKGKLQESAAQLEEAQEFVEDNANLHYNMGLIYLDLGEFEKSLKHAHQAYLLGFPLEGLRNRLKRAGKWKDPVYEEGK